MTDTLFTALISATGGLLVGGVLLDGVADVVAVVGGITVLTGATARYGAVLMRRSEKAVTRFTAYGFFVGLVISVVVVVVDAFWGVSLVAMNARQIIGFGVAVALIAAAAVATLNIVDASQEIAALVVLVIAAGAGTAIGVFGEPAESERGETHSVGGRTRPHAS